MVVLNTAFADSIVEKVCMAFNNKFNIALEKTPEFSVFDLKDKVNKIAVEIKQRNIQHNRYNEAIIGWNKYIKARSYIKRGYTPIFVWYYNDGIYCYKYNDEKFEKRNNGYGSDIIYIPIDNLQKLDDLEDINRDFTL
jgi:hypothetical protein